MSFGRRRPSASAGDRAPREVPKAGRITAVVAQQRDPERVNVSIDGAFAFGLHVEVMMRHGLAVGVTLDDAMIATLLAEDVFQKAVAAALQLLSYRTRSEQEIAKRLHERGFADDVIAATLERLRDWHYVDDGDFAARWIEQRQTFRPRAKRLLKQELRLKGVEAETIDEAIDEAGLDEVGDARRLVERQRAKLASLEPEVRVRRITGFLARRGYGYDVIRQALREDLDDIDHLGAEDEDPFDQ